MNKKNIALIIQISLILTLSIVLFSTYRAIQNDQQIFGQLTSGIVSGDNACPSVIKRTCCDVSYCTKVEVCPLLPRECNSQNDLKFCFQYSWKNIPKGQPGMCSSCGSTDADIVTYKKYIECASKNK